MSKVKQRDESADTVRTSVTLSMDDYDQLSRIADEKKVSIAWVVRDAVEH